MYHSGLEPLSLHSLVNWFTGFNWNQRTAINAWQRVQAITDTELVESFLPIHLLVRTHVFNGRMDSALQQINHWLVDKRSWDRNFCLFVLGNRLIVSQTFYYLFQSVKMMYPRQLVWTLYVFAISNKYIQSVLRLAASVSVSISIIISQKLSVDFRLLMKTPNDERISAQLQINVLLRFTGHS